jgi:hypothetical protein
VAPGIGAERQARDAAGACDEGVEER